MEDILSTREALLRLLLRKKEGLTVEEMVKALGVTRNAVRQHIASLERDELLRTADVRRAFGRPSRVYALTKRGLEQFPKQYSMLARLLLQSIRHLHGEPGTRQVIEAMADSLAAEFAPQVHGKSLTERMESVVAIMNRLHFDATVEQQGSEASIAAVNCIYHYLTPAFREVCQLDVELMSRLLGEEVELSECMGIGGHVCRFKPKLAEQWVVAHA